jgi:hypothetical protein
VGYRSQKVLLKKIICTLTAALTPLKDSIAMYTFNFFLIYFFSEKSSFYYNLIKRSDLGMFDKNAKLDRNFGILDGRVHQIDIGSYRPIMQEMTNDFLYDDIRATTSTLRKWLQEQDPSLCDFLDQKVNELHL